MLAAAGVAHPPLLGALRRALRQRLNMLKPRQLVAVASGLAGLRHRDLLLTDELAKCAGGGGMLLDSSMGRSCLRSAALSLYCTATFP